MSAADVLKLIEESKAKFVDLRFTDTIGKEQHVTVPVSAVDEDFFEEGKMFDGSSISGWKGINDSDMVMLPDTSTAIIDPFFQDTTINIRCDVVNPNTLDGYDRDPRTIAKRAEAYMRSLNVGDDAFFGPENEFFLFNDVRWATEMNNTFFAVDSEEGFWNSKTEYEDGNMGHRPGIKGGYFPVPPVDSQQDVRAAMSLCMEEMGLEVEVLHHEVATGGQGELGVKFNTLVKKADEVQIYKYCVHNVAHQFGLTATFMPKPLVGDNGSGMHVHQSIFKDGDSLFAGNEYGGLSKEALYYVGGIFKHAKAINAFANASVNSYRRLVPGYEAPVLLAYSAKNRSASCRIPHSPSSKGRRIEIRFPDSTANPYLAFSAMLMAGLDGIKNKIDPGEAMDKDLYDLPPEEEKAIPRVARDLEDALLGLDADREFLTTGGVFSDDMIDAYIELKMEEVDRIKLAVHPAEFDMYYSC